MSRTGPCLVSCLAVFTAVPCLMGALVVDSFTVSDSVNLGVGDTSGSSSGVSVTSDVLSSATRVLSLEANRALQSYFFGFIRESITLESNSPAGNLSLSQTSIVPPYNATLSYTDTFDLTTLLGGNSADDYFFELDIASSNLADAIFTVSLASAAGTADYVATVPANTTGTGIQLNFSSSSGTFNPAAVTGLSLDARLDPAGGSLLGTRSIQISELRVDVPEPSAVITVGTVVAVLGIGGVRRWRRRAASRKA